jgi:hypothetical protein
VSVYGTGASTLGSGFSRQCGSILFGTYFPSPSGFRIIRSFIPRLSSTLRRALPVARLDSPPASPLPFYRLAAVQESQPVVHRLRFLSLTLGPDLPWADEPSPGNLGFSTVKFLTSLSLLIPAFSLVPRPHVFPVVLLPVALCSPTVAASNFFSTAPHSFGMQFSPEHFRRRLTRLVSCYALFE